MPQRPSKPTPRSSRSIALVTVVTLESDFARFTGLKWMSPLAPT
jgi:hypothetical protein